MTAEQIEQWKRERDIARAIQDHTERTIALEKVYDHRDDMQMECIQHQADRIKAGLKNDEMLNSKLDKMSERIDKVEDEIVPLEKTTKEIDDWKLKAQGAKIMWSIIRYLIAAGAGGVIYKFAEAQ